MSGGKKILCLLPSLENSEDHTGKYIFYSKGRNTRNVLNLLLKKFKLA